MPAEQQDTEAVADWRNIMPRGFSLITVTRKDLASSVYDCIGISRKDADRLVSEALSEITEALVRGENVRLASFGNFEIRAKTQRIGRNPRTGVAAVIPPRRVLKFKASKVLLDRLNGDCVTDSGKK